MPTKKSKTVKKLQSVIVGGKKVGACLDTQPSTVDVTTVPLPEDGKQCETLITGWVDKQGVAHMS